MAANNEQQEGDAMLNKNRRRQILETIEKIENDEHCTELQAMLIYVTELIENDPRAKLAEMWIRAENSGRKQAAAVLDSLIKKMEEEQRKR